MSYFPQLDKRSLEELKNLFASGHVFSEVAEEPDLWFREIAAQIARNGEPGLDFLLRLLSSLDDIRKRAALAALSFLPQELIDERLDELKEVCLPLLNSENPFLIVESVDNLRIFCYKDVESKILPLLSHASPYVVGSALRFISCHFPTMAKPILLDALESPEPIVRQNAIDELDELGAIDALPQIRKLLDDEDEDVREAAQSAVNNLTKQDQTIR